jgi:hypothetical protein
MTCHFKSISSHSAVVGVEGYRPVMGAARGGLRNTLLRGLLTFAAMLSGTLVGPGCASNRVDTNVRIAPDQYTAAFEAARDVLREYKFTLERVDAQQGIITTAPKDSAGLATPWDTQQTHLSQDISDFVNHQQRRVRVTFPQNTAVGGSGEVTSDRLVQVEVYVDRLHSPGLRVPSRAPTLLSISRDPVANARGVAYQYPVTRQRDGELEKRIADRVQKRLEERAAHAVGTADLGTGST